MLFIAFETAPFMFSSLMQQRGEERFLQKSFLSSASNVIRLRKRGSFSREAAGLVVSISSSPANGPPSP